jgi:citronellol/citronellal dehydrogenase
MTSYGYDDETLLSLPTVYRSDLFSGQVALVSGGGSGLGKAIAVLLGRLGARLVLCGRDSAKLDAVRALLHGASIAVETHALTIRDPDAVSEMMDGVFERHGRLDLLVNNAGGQYPQAAIDFTAKGWNAVIDTNLSGTWYMMQAAARRWRDRGQTGCIVNIVADIWRGMPQMAHTAAARAGVVYLSRTVAVEWAPLGIRVNCVAPGCCETSAFDRYPPAGAASFEQSNPLKRSGDAQDIAEAVIYLAASSGKFVTGETITVDGGQQLWGDPWAAGRPPWFELDYERSRLQDDPDAPS